MADHLAKVAAFSEELIGVGFLEIAATNFRRWDLGGDGENWNTRAMAIEQAIDQMKVARPAAPGANCKFACEMGLSASREGRCLFMPGVDPFDVLANPQRLGQSVQAVAYDAIDATHARSVEDICDEVCCFLVLDGNLNS